MVENPELDAFVCDKFMYDKEGNLIQWKLNGLFINCVGKLIINLVGGGVKTDTLYDLLCRKKKKKYNLLNVLETKK